jgi:hypothetical protein
MECYAIGCEWNSRLSWPSSFSIECRLEPPNCRKLQYQVENYFGEVAHAATWNKRAPSAIYGCVRYIKTGQLAVNRPDFPQSQADYAGSGTHSL